ncbi:MAG: hypothetical protein MRK01_16690 [Candidatus Scalindua sp.]|nr:hypothetical protein [Candidatus Scalindua sp.]
MSWNASRSPWAGGAAIQDSDEGPIIQLPEGLLLDSGTAVLKRGTDAIL